MKVVVTGGSGFIGSHVTECLIANGFEVVVLDHNPPKTSGVVYVTGDLQNPRECESAFMGADAVIHLAARVRRNESQERAWQDLLANSKSTANALSISARMGVGTIILSSTGGVYGNTSLRGATERIKCHPKNPYAFGKCIDEGAALSYGHANPDLRVAILRLFNCFGERQQPHRPGAVVSTFIAQALEGKNLLLDGDGRQVRDYLYVKDVAQAYLCALRSEVKGIFNVASGTPRTTASIANAVIAAAGNSRARARTRPWTDSAVRCSVGDASKFSTSTGWKPSHDFGSSLRRVVEWYRSMVRASQSTLPRSKRLV